GSEVQAPLARVVIGGLTTSALITLVLIPVLYATVKEWQEVGIRQWRLTRWVPLNGRIFRK
ncbi:MAG: efflux RND transporter permease subunit, partial [Deltaproteobacteria bacterium]|nr:efflux RND transporter permease subunit [Deltaproteobacteria bacterium]